MQKTNQSYKFTLESVKGGIKVQAQNGGTKGNSKPSSGGTQAGPPPPPLPQKK
jgi:hypothetical protein